MNPILSAALSLTAIGAVCAAVLCAAARIMAVQTDERVARLLECLPGSNCGACGYPGCEGYAAALASTPDMNPGLCAPGGKEALDQLRGILGADAAAFVKKTATVHCRGGTGAQKRKTDYAGIQTCAAAKPLFGGEGACAFGCMGYGDCQKLCLFDAICIKDGLAQIIAARCTGCGACQKACPNRLITVGDASATVAVLCNNLEKGAAARKKCANACLGCRKCARECPEGAIEVQDYLAKIDYEKCTNCNHCAEICVARCISVDSGQWTEEARRAANKAGTAKGGRGNAGDINDA